MVVNEATIEPVDTQQALPQEARVWAWGEQIFEAAPNGMLLVNEDGLIARANDELCAMFGYDRQDLLGQPVHVLLPERYHEGHPDLQRRYQENPERRSMGAGRDLFGRRKNGDEFPVEIGLNPIVLAGQSMILASVVNITDRKRLELLFGQIVEASPQGLVMVDMEATIRLANRSLCTMFGYEPGDIVGKPVEELLPLRTREGHKALRDAFIANPVLRPMGAGRDLTALHADGSEFPVEIGLTPVITAEGQMVLASITDITKRKNSEHLLKQANIDLEEFTSVASHDLRSPLRGLSSLLEWIDEDLGDNKPQEIVDHLDKAITRVKRMENLITDLLSYARAGQDSQEVETIDIKAMVNDILDLTEPPATFTFEKNLQLTRLVGSRTPVETCLRNLIGNAVKHHDRDDGHVEISCVEEGGFCVFRVADDGPGIPPTVHDRIFKLFQTLNKSRDGGTGLGLAITKRLVERHGGSIAIQSNENSRGTAFVVRWPMFHRRDLERDDR